MHSIILIACFVISIIFDHLISKPCCSPKQRWWHNMAYITNPWFSHPNPWVEVPKGRKVPILAHLLKPMSLISLTLMQKSSTLLMVMQNLCWGKIWVTLSKSPLFTPSEHVHRDSWKTIMEVSLLHEFQMLIHDHTWMSRQHRSRTAKTYHGEPLHFQIAKVSLFSWAAEHWSTAFPEVQ